MMRLRGRAVIIGFLLLFVLSGCGLLSENRSAKVDPKATTNNEHGIPAFEESTEPSPAASEQPGDGKKIRLNLYFADSDNSALKKESREVVIKDGAIMRAAVEALLSGPSDGELRKTFPEGTSLLGIKKDGDTAVVDFSREYTLINGIAEIVERASLVNTLTEVPGIDKVRILVEGKELAGPSGNPYGEMVKFQLDESGYPAEPEEKTITLYFAAEDAEKLMAEHRKVNLFKGETLEKAVIQELKRGPANKNLFSVIPEGTRILSVQTKDGICTVNFSKEFVENNHSGSAGESMTIYSIVNSLTELPRVKKVKFLIEGKERDVYIHTILDEPFTRNESIIKK
ncbi:MAG: GerMN domain-containing protein [Clostridia bacterium]|nr:GerMN domain-containing protein [Clostridia bacterium]